MGSEETVGELTGDVWASFDKKIREETNTDLVFMSVHEILMGNDFESIEDLDAFREYGMFIVLKPDNLFDILDFDNDDYFSYWSHDAFITNLKISDLRESEEPPSYSINDDTVGILIINDPDIQKELRELLDVFHGVEYPDYDELEAEFYSMMEAFEEPEDLIEGYNPEDYEWEGPEDPNEWRDEEDEEPEDAPEE